MYFVFRLGKGNLIFCCTVSGENYISQWINKIIILILSFRVDTSNSKNKNVDYRVKETCAIISTQVTY